MSSQWKPSRHSTRHFLMLWAAETCSMTGNGLTSFALGVWVYQKTGSSSMFTWLALAALLPGQLLLPFAGVWVDRFSRKRIMQICNLVAGGCALGMIVLLMGGHDTYMELLYVLMAVGAGCRALQWIAFSASMSMMVRDEMLGRMSALIYTGEAGQQILAPALGALLLISMRTQGLVALDLATFVLALGVLWRVHVPQPEVDESNDVSHGWRVGWRFIWRRPSLWWLQCFFALSQFFGAFLAVLITPLLLDLTGSDRVTGYTMACAGLGMLCGTMWATWRPERANKIPLILGLNAAASVCMGLVGLGTQAWWLALSGFGFLFLFGAESGVSQALWQRKTPAAQQGQIFAVRRFLSWSLIPVAYGLAGPLADALKGHRMLPSLWEHAGGQMGFLITIAAVCRLIMVVCVTRIEPLRTLHERVPDLHHRTP